MAEDLKFDLLQLDGGLNTASAAEQIADTEAVSSENFYSWGKNLISRKGLTRLTSTPYHEKISGVHSYRMTNGERLTLVVGRTSVAKLDGQTLKTIPRIADSTPILDKPEPPSIEQYRGIVYICRKGMSRIQRTNGSVVGDAGLPDPVSAPTLAEGAAGLLKAGTYKGILVFRNSVTGHTSGWSPTGEVTITDDKKINWSALDVSTNWQVDSKELYRSTKNGSGRFYFVKKIPNHQKTFEDNTEDVNLGEPATSDNGPIPDSLVAIRIWKERLWGSDGRDLFFSRELFPESFSSDFIIQVGPNDGQDIRGLLGLDQMLIVGKTRSTRYITGSHLGDFDARGVLSDRHGVASHHSMAGLKRMAFWFGGDDFYVTEGSDVQGFATNKIKSIIEAIPEKHWELVQGFIYPKLGWYVASVPDESGENVKELVFNYNTGVWEVFTHDFAGQGKGFSYAGEFVVDDQKREMYATYYDNHLYRYHDGGTDAGTPIVCRRRTKEYGFDQNGILKALRKLHLLVGPIDESLTIRVFKDRASSAVKTKTVSLSGGRPWKRTGLNNLRKPGNTVSFELE